MFWMGVHIMSQRRSCVPKISIVTPSFNQAAFLEATIQSVLSQDYPNLEYIVMDGGSTDGSVEIIKRYEGRLAYWVSAKDGGQADAINKGFRQATGDILAWLNSDDMYLPGALAKVARVMPCTADAGIIFGNCIHINDLTGKLYGSDVVCNYEKWHIEQVDYIEQPSAFFSRSAWEKTGDLAIDLCYCLDWDWFIRAHDLGILFHPISDYLSIYRLHEGHKTGSGGDNRRKEISGIYHKYISPRVAEAYISRPMNTRLKIMKKILRSMRIHKLFDIDPWLRVFFYPHISDIEFKAIQRM
jgi:glycosyltransferase involved in cell wall biosynthesis